MARTAIAEPLWRTAVAGFLLAWMAAGCTINPPLELTEVVGPEAVLHLSSVPFFPQAEYQCGPTALAGVLGAAGVGTDLTVAADGSGAAVLGDPPVTGAPPPGMAPRR